MKQRFYRNALLNLKKIKQCYHLLKLERRVNFSSLVLVTRLPEALDLSILRLLGLRLKVDS